MEWLNYHHLYYFWISAREGSIVKSSEKLFVSQPTISAQIKSLEDSLGERLFERVGRRLVLNEAGHIAMKYAEDIFGLGKEMRDTLKGRPSAKLPVLSVGISDALSKLVAYRLLKPIQQGPELIRLICREDRTDNLIAGLGAQKLDLLLTDAPLPPGTKVKAFNHLLGESGVTFFATAELTAKFKRGFPGSLHGAPLLCPADNTSLRRGLDRWLENEKIQPQIVGEFEDGALMKVFGQHGAGLFLGPTYVEAEIRTQYKVSVVGRTEAVKEQFYAISPERKIKQPAVAKILNASPLGGNR
jgi:LysR family transcriptional regulator, transcriptional activator of nhaA